MSLFPLTFYGTPEPGRRRTDERGTETYPAQIIQSMQLRAQTTVDAQKLLVHHRRQWQVAERVHARVVDRLGVLVLAYTGQLSSVR
jgi:hypothetical protein